MQIKETVDASDDEVRLTKYLHLGAVVLGWKSQTCMVIIRHPRPVKRLITKRFQTPNEDGARAEFRHMALNVDHD